MSMPVEKAKSILTSYKDMNYNGVKALEAVGYAGNNARKNGGQIINRAVNSLAAAGEHDALLEFAGMTKADLSREYQSIIKQNKNFPAKLRAMEPLLAKHGIKWDDQKTTVSPTLNLTVKEIVRPQSSAKHVAQSTLCDTDSTATLSDDSGDDNEDTGAGVDSPNQDKKEGDSPIQNIVENLTIDNSDSLSSNDSQLPLEVSSNDSI